MQQVQCWFYCCGEEVDSHHKNRIKTGKIDLYVHLNSVLPMGIYPMAQSLFMVNRALYLAFLFRRQCSSRMLAYGIRNGKSRFLITFQLNTERKATRKQFIGPSRLITCEASHLRAGTRWFIRPSHFFLGSRYFSYQTHGFIQLRILGLRFSGCSCCIYWCKETASRVGSKH